MLGVNKKKFGVELCETSHKLLGASQVESSIKKNPCEFSFFFVLYVEAIRMFFHKLIKVLKEQNNSHFGC
jgi:hypothetical protein